MREYRVGGKKTAAILSGMILIISLIGCSHTKSETAVNQQQAGTEGSVEQFLTDVETGSAGKAMGRYVEESIDVPDFAENEYQMYMDITPNQNFRIVTSEWTESGGCNYRSYTKVGEQWEKEELSWLNQLKEYGYINCLVEGSDGVWYILTDKSEENEKTSEYIITQFLLQYTEQSQSLADITPKEWCDTSDLEDEEKKYVSINKLQVQSDGSILYMSSMLNTIHLYNPKTQENVELQGLENATDVFVKDNRIYVLLAFEKTVKVFDEKGYLKRTIEIETSGYDGHIFANSMGDIYFIDSTGFYRNADGGTLWEQVMKGKDSYIGTSNSYANQLIILEAQYDEFYLSAMGQEQQLLHIFFNETIPSDREKSLNIYSLNEDEQLKDTVVEYQKLHPEVDVNYMVGVEANEKGMEEEQIRVVNSELIAGGGADIYLMDGLPSLELTAKNVMADLRPILAEFLDGRELMENIVEYYQKSTGEIYQLPLKFKAPLLVYCDLVNKKPTDMGALVEAQKQNPKLYMYKNLSALSSTIICLETYGQSMVDEQGIQIDSWKKLMEDLMASREHVNMTYSDDLLMGVDYLALAYPSNTDMLMGGDYTSLMTGEYLSSFFSFGLSDDIMILDALCKKYKCSYATLYDCFQPLGRIGLNQNAKNQEEAVQFIQFAFGQKMQEVRNYIGLPVNQKSLEKMFKDEELHCGSGSYASTDDSGKEWRLETEWPGEDAVSEYINLLHSLKRPVMEDVKLLQILLESSKKVMEGEFNLEQAAQELKNRVDLYLAE